jgi:hypothetical protein
MKQGFLIFIENNDNIIFEVAHEIGLGKIMLPVIWNQITKGRGMKKAGQDWL